MGLAGVGGRGHALGLRQLARGEHPPARARPRRRGAGPAVDRAERPGHARRVWCGDFETAAVADRGGRRASSEATGTRIAPYGALLLAAFRGRTAEASDARSTPPSTTRSPGGEGLGIQYAHWATAILHNGLGRYEEALAAAAAGEPTTRPSCSSPTWALPRADRGGRRSGKRRPRARRCAASGWRRPRRRRHRLGAGHRGPLAGAAERGRGRRGRSTARRSIGSAAPGCGPSSPAPTCSTASGCAARAAASTRASSCAPPTSMFAAMGMEAFAERARRELLATGETVRKRRDDTRDELTPQEEHIARLARDGRTNPEIGARAVPQPPHRRVAPAQGVHQARDQLAQGPPRRPPPRPARRRA